MLATSLPRTSRRRRTADNARRSLTGSDTYRLVGFVLERSLQVRRTTTGSRPSVAPQAGRAVPGKRATEDVLAISLTGLSGEICPGDRISSPTSR
jgi:hypothetical protein